MSHVFDGYAPVKGEIPERRNGVLVSQDDGAAVAYALWKLQERGRMFVNPGDPVYEGMIIGIHSRDNDLVVNPIRTKQLTNIRASGKDEAILLTPPIALTLEYAVEFIGRRAPRDPPKPSPPPRPPQGEGGEGDRGGAPFLRPSARQRAADGARLFDVGGLAREVQGPPRISAASRGPRAADLDVAVAAARVGIGLPVLHEVGLGGLRLLPRTECTRRQRFAQQRSGAFSPGRRAAFGPPAQAVSSGACMGSGVQKVGNGASGCGRTRRRDGPFPRMRSLNAMATRITGPDASLSRGFSSRGVKRTAATAGHRAEA